MSLPVPSFSRDLCWIFDCEIPSGKYCKECTECFCVNHCPFRLCRNCEVVYIKESHFNSPTHTFNLAFLLFIVFMDTVILASAFRESPIHFHILFYLSFLPLLFSLAFYLKGRKKMLEIRVELSQGSTSSIVSPVRDPQTTEDLRQKITRAEKRCLRYGDFCYPC